uniref:Uncharacterized protein n=1 Tax=Haptolina brevifila TaxID=156173 RepID=A0A7S2N6D7_9EUKA
MSAARLLRVTTTTDTKLAEEALHTAIADLSATEMTSEVVSSYYWWDGGVQNDEEVRLSFTTEQSLEATLAKIGSAHNYDVPMIIADSSDVTSPYWKGLFNVDVGRATELADVLVKGRLVACAQVTADGSVALKTTAKAKVAVEKIVETVTWVPIEGNKPYMDWLDEETRNAETCE